MRFAARALTCFLLACGGGGAIRAPAALSICAPPLDEAGDNCHSPAVHFGEIIEKYAGERVVRVRSTGSANAMVAAPVLDTAGMQLPECAQGLSDQDKATIFTLDATGTETVLMQGDKLDVHVHFAPPCAGPYSATFVIGSNDPRQGKREIHVDGKALADCTSATEPFVTQATQVDLLFVIDDTQSMEHIQATVKQQAGRLFNALVAKQVDFHVAAITTDLNPSAPSHMGKLVLGKVITSADLDPVAQFQTVMDAINTASTSRAWGLAASTIALMPGNQTWTMNTSGFGVLPAYPGQRDPILWRDNARLVVVIVSNDDDSGDAGTYAELIPPTTYAQALQGFKPTSLTNPSDLLVAAIVEPSVAPPLSCPDPFPAAWNPGDPLYSYYQSIGTPRYHSFISALGKSGVLYSLCSDWGGSLQSIGELASAPQCNFALKSGPPTMDAPQSVCVGTSCLQTSDFHFEAPTTDFPKGRLLLNSAACPTVQSNIDYKYEICMRSQDIDRDGVPDKNDNCPGVANPNQEDENYDGKGDACP